MLGLSFHDTREEFVEEDGISSDSDDSVGCYEL